MVLAITFAGWRWGPPAWRQTKILYWQRQCLNYSAGPEKIVYEEALPAAERLLSQDSQYSRLGIVQSGRNDLADAAQSLPECWERLFATTHGMPYPTPPLFRNWILGAIVFLHERTAPNGRQRLVCIALVHSNGDFADCSTGLRSYKATTIQSTKLPFPANRISESCGSAREILSWPEPQIRIYAGQPDPADASHFTIRYEMWGQSDILDGWLRDDDSVTLTPRKMPQEPQSK